MQRYGLVDTSEIKRKERRSQWANRYNDRLPHSALEGQPYAEGQEGGGSSVDLSDEQAGRAAGANGEFWNANEERYYGQNGQNGRGDSSSVLTSGSGRWRYPANFEDAELPRKKSIKKSKKDKKDRWARTEDAYAAQEEGSTRRRKSKKRRSAAAAVVDADTYSQRSESTTEFPEDPEGGLYGDRRPTAGRDGAGQDEPRRTNDEDIFNHEL